MGWLMLLESLLHGKYGGWSTWVLLPGAGQWVPLEKGLQHDVWG